MTVWSSLESGDFFSYNNHMLFYNLTIDEALKKLGSRREGLTVNEVKNARKNLEKTLSNFAANRFGEKF